MLREGYLGVAQTRLIDLGGGAWEAAGWVVTGLYLVAPILLVALALHRPRRDGKRAAPWVKPSAALGTVVAGVTLGAGLTVVYGVLITGSIWRVSIGQVLLAAYLGIGLLALLKAFDAAARYGVRAALRPFTRSGSTSSARSAAALATFIRVLVLLCVGLPFVMAAAMTYRPKAVPVETPLSELRAPFEPLRIETPDRLTLAGWWVPAEEPSDRAVLIVPGLGSGKADVLLVVQAFITTGHNVLVFDPRAHGDSDGQVTSFGDRERLDVLAALAWLQENHPDQARQVFGVGISMGGAALLGAAAEFAEFRPFQAIAVIDTYDDLSALASRLVGEQFAFAPPVRWVARAIALPLASAHTGRPLHRLRPNTYVDHIWPTPLLVIHSEHDELIPFAAGQRLFAEAEEPKEAFWTRRLTHNTVATNEAVLKAVIAFFARAEEWRPIVQHKQTDTMPPRSNPAG